MKTKTLLFPLTTQSEASCHSTLLKNKFQKQRKKEEEEEDQNPREITDQDQSSLHTKLKKDCFKIYRESKQCKKSPPKFQKLTNKRLSTHESNPSRQRRKKNTEILKPKGFICLGNQQQHQAKPNTPPKKN
jgi:hypothetical protein